MDSWIGGLTCTARRAGAHRLDQSVSYASVYDSGSSRHYVDAEDVPFIVVPGNFLTSFPSGAPDPEARSCRRLRSSRRSSSLLTR
jgi:hypothetical protein